MPVHTRESQRAIKDVKNSVRAATTANIVLSGTQTIDGVVLVVGDRVLVKNQAAGAQNGIYVVQAAAWTRAQDADSNDDLTSGCIVPVTEGTTNGDKAFILATNDPITVGTTSLSWVETAAASIAAHEAAADPHTGYQKESEKGVANGYAGLDANQNLSEAAKKVQSANAPATAGDLQGGAGGLKHHDGTAIRTTLHDGNPDGATLELVGGVLRAKDAGITDAKLATPYLKADGTRALTGDQSAGGFKLTNLGAPTADNDAARKAYVDALVQGLDPKNSVRAATTGALPAHGRVGNVLTASANGALPAIDGVTLVANDRLLVKDEGAGTHLENGIYVVTQVGNAGAPWILTRASDADADAEVTSGLFVFISEGTVNADSGWVLTTNDPITLNTTALTFTQFSGAGQIVAGAALTKTGNQLDVAVDNATIEVNADALRVKDGGITNAKVATGIGGDKIDAAAAATRGTVLKAAALAAAAASALTDSTGGARDNTVEAMPALQATPTGMVAGERTAIDNNFSELTEEVNALRARLEDLIAKQQTAGQQT